MHIPLTYASKMILFAGYFIAFNLHAQKEANNWILNNSSLNFNTQEVSVIPNSMFNLSSSGYTSISDSLGNLLFFTNSFKIYDRNYQVMNNGDSLLPPGYHSGKQESVIFPKPGSNSIYYIFTTDPFNNFNWQGLYYSMVDMSLNGGQGKVVLKGIKIQDSTTNKIAATYDLNHRDVWLIVHKYRSNHFYAYKITPAGISTNPVINRIGRSDRGDSGQLKISPDSKTAAVSMDEFDTWGVDLFDFDNSTGIFSNVRSFWVDDSYYSNCYDMEYSPDGRKIYLGITNYLYQFNITLPTGPEITASAREVLQMTYNDPYQMQLGPDHKIYFMKGGGSVYGLKYLGVISQPNISGDSCQAVECGLYLNEGYSADAYTPNFLHEYFYKPTDFVVQKACLSDSVIFKLSFVPGMDSIFWSFGDGLTDKSLHPKHKYVVTGDYEVMSVAWYPGIADTTFHTITIHPSPVFSLGPDTAVCSGYQLKVTNPDYHYVWNNGDTSHSITPGASGTYWITATNQFSCAITDTLHLVLYPLPQFSLGNDTSVCSGSFLLLSPNIQGQDYNYTWNNGSTASSLQVSTGSLYWLMITDTSGCQFTDTITVQTAPVPAVNLGKDTILSCHSTLYLSAGYYGDPNTYLWDDNSQYPTRILRGSELPEGPSVFYVTVISPNHCIGSDTIMVTGFGPDACQNLEPILYPNPCDGVFYIRLPEISNLTVNLYSLFGQLLETLELQRKDLYRIDFTDLPKGPYIIRYSFGAENTITDKLIII